MKKKKLEKNYKMSWKNSKNLVARWLISLMKFRNKKLKIENFS